MQGLRELHLDGDISFKENQLQTGWINGGFFVIEPNFINYIKDENDVRKTAFR